MIRILPQFFTFKKPKDHSDYSPSSYERWNINACPASIRLSKNIHIPDTKDSIRGTLAHSLCEAVYNKEAYFQEIPAELILKINQFSIQHDEPNLYSEMLSYAYQYVDLISEWMQESRIGKVLWHGLEHAMPIVPEKGVYGTGDVVIIGTKAAVVIDLKYGVGKVVEANSVQLLAYLVAVWRHLENIPHDYTFYSVIFQPRVNLAAKVAQTNAAGIDKVFRDIWASVEASLNPSIAPVEGNHCFWCPAKRTTDPTKKCPAIKQKAEDLMRSEMSGMLRILNGKVEVIDNAYEKRRDEAARKILAMKNYIIDVIENLEEEYKDRILKGENIHGLTVEEELGNRTFVESNPVELEKLLRAKVPDVNPIKTIPEHRKIKTITEIEKESKIKDCLAGLTIRRSTKVLKVQDDATITALSEMLRLTKEPLV